MDVKRQKIQALIDGVMKRLDPTGTNAKKYRDKFAKMSDQQFKSWVENFLKDEKSNLRLDIEEFGDGSRNLKYENIEAAAQFIGVPLYEYVYLPHVSSDPNRPVRTRQPVLVGYLNIKRTQQLVTKKTGLALTDSNRDEETGAAKGDAKGGTQTAIENELLAGTGGDIIISEFSGARGDNVAEYDNMLESIATSGSVKLADIKTGVYDKPTLLKADLYFMAMGVKTDLISASYYSIDKMRAVRNNV